MTVRQPPLVFEIVREWRRSLFAQFALVVGILVLIDAGTNALLPRDAASGRSMGCYTILEQAVGATAPTTWARPLEYLIGVASFTVAFVLLWRAYHATRLRSSSR